MASSFRMMLFPPCEAMTTAEPPELLIFQHSDSIMNNKLLRRLSARRRGILVYSVYSVDSSLVFISVHSWFLSSRSFEMRRDLPRGGGIDGGRPRRIVVQADFRERNRPHGGTRRERLP